MILDYCIWSDSIQTDKEKLSHALHRPIYYGRPVE